MGPRRKGSGGDDADLVRLYLSDIGRYPLLTRDDEGRLARLIEDGATANQDLETNLHDLSSADKRRLRVRVRAGKDAEQEFIQSNLRLVVSIAKKYQYSEVPLLDLIQEGNLGLVHAVGKFDWRKGFKFSTYATWWIRQAISRGIANSGRTIRLPVHAGEMLNRLNQARTRLEAQLNRPPTRSELASELDLPESKVAEIQRFSAQPRSIFEPVGKDGGTEFADIIADRAAELPDEAAAKSLLPEQVSRLLDGLPERDRRILELRFGLDRGEPRTLEEVGDILGLTRERIRQIEARALSRLRHPSLETGARELAP